MPPFASDGTSQTDNLVHGFDERSDVGPDGRHAQRISRLHAKLVETIASGKQDRSAASRRVALSRVVSACLIVTTVVSCLLLQRSGLADLALGRMSVAIVALLWFLSTFVEAFKRDTRRACDRISLLCFVAWSISHVIWRATSTEAASGRGIPTDGVASSGTGGGSILVAGASDGAAPAWVWVDIGIAWALAPVIGGSLQLGLWVAMVPSWLCVTLTVGYEIRAEEVALDGDDAGAPGALLVGIAICGVAILSIGYQALWEEARSARTFFALEDRMVVEDERQRQSRFSELLLRHLVTEPSLQVLGAGVKELFNDSRIFVMHSDALEQIQDGVSMLVDYGEIAHARLRSGAPELPSPVLEDIDMEELLDACLRTTAYLAISRDHHKVQIDMRVAPDVDKTVKTFRLWLSQMTRACLIHALHPDEEKTVILRVSYARPGVMRVGVEAMWRAAGPAGAGTESTKPRMLSGWDRDMPAAAWWVRAAALALGCEADYNRSADRPGYNELWFTIPAVNVSEEDQKKAAEEKEAATLAAPAADGREQVGLSERQGVDAHATIGERRKRASVLDRQDEEELSSRSRPIGPQPKLERDYGTRSPTTKPSGTRTAELPLPRPRASFAPRASTSASPAALGGGALLSPLALSPTKKKAADSGSTPMDPISAETSEETPLTPVTAFDNSAAAGNSRTGSAIGNVATTAKADGNDDVVKIEAAARAAAAAMATAKVNARGELCEKRDSGGDADGSIVGRVEGDARGRLSSADRIRLSRVPADASWSPLTTGATGSEHELFPRLTHHIRDSDRNDNDTMERPTSAPAPGSSSRSSRKPREVDSVKTRGRGIGDHRADARPTSAPKLERGTGSLSVAVRGVLGTTNGLENLRSSLQGTGSGSGALEIAAMSRLASMASMSNSVNKKASVFGGLVHSLMDTSTNSMSWLGSTNKSNMGPPDIGDVEESDSDDDSMSGRLKILLVDPQGLLRWVPPRLKEKKGKFSVTEAHSAEEAMEMMESNTFEVVVVDLHMPRINGMDFCRAICQADSGGSASMVSAVAGGGGAAIRAGSLSAIPTMAVPADRVKLLLHTTAAGSVKSDDLEAFLEEGLVKQYVPQPLDITILFDFLKLFEEEYDEHGVRKLSVLLAVGADGSRLPASQLAALGTTATTAAGKVGAKTVHLARSITGSARFGTFAKHGEALGGERSVNGVGDAVGRGGGVRRWWGKRSPPPPSVDDLASNFFTVKGDDLEGQGSWRGINQGPRDTFSSTRMQFPAANPAAVAVQPKTRIPGPWRPGPAPISPV